MSAFTVTGFMILMLLLILPVLFSNGNAQSDLISDISDSCLQCLAQSSSSFKNECHPDPDVGTVCGIYQLTMDMWTEAGKFSVQDNNQAKMGNLMITSSSTEFKNCALDKKCAARAIRAYMGTYYRDCNNDGVVNCEDFDRIHFLGPECDEESYEDDEHYFTFIRCLNKLHLTPIGDFSLSPSI